jgi:hypothetical protein
VSQEGVANPLFLCNNVQVIEGYSMDLSELIDEIREIKIYETDPKDWMGVLEEDDYWEVATELVY